jgi:hypothetical protein
MPRNIMLYLMKLVCHDVRKALTKRDLVFYLAFYPNYVLQLSRFTRAFPIPSFLSWFEFLRCPNYINGCAYGDAQQRVFDGKIMGKNDHR